MWQVGTFGGINVVGVDLGQGSDRGLLALVASRDPEMLAVYRKDSDGAVWPANHLAAVMDAITGALDTLAYAEASASSLGHGGSSK